jgi:hypothetical protein
MFKYFQKFTLLISALALLFFIIPSESASESLLSFGASDGISSAAALIFVPAMQAVQADPDYGLKATAEKAGLGDSPAPDIPTRLSGIIATALSFIGVLFLILTIYAGITYMLAQGEPAKTKKALDILVAAIIGLIIVSSAYAITSFVIGAA